MYIKINIQASLRVLFSTLSCHNYHECAYEYYDLLNPICAEIFSYPIGAGGGGSRMTPPLISGHSGHKETN